MTIRARTRSRKSCSGSSPSCTAPVSNASWRSRATKRPRSSTGSSPTSWSPACLIVHDLHPQDLTARVEAGARVGPPVPRVARRQRGARRGRARGAGGAPASARELRRLPVVGDHAPARSGTGDPRRRARGRAHRRRFADRRSRQRSSRAWYPCVSCRSRCTKSVRREWQRGELVESPRGVAPHPGPGSRTPVLSRGNAASSAPNRSPRSTAIWSTSSSGR